MKIFAVISSDSNYYMAFGLWLLVEGSCQHVLINGYVLWQVNYFIRCQPPSLHSHIPCCCSTGIKAINYSIYRTPFVPVWCISTFITLHILAWIWCM